MTNAAHTPPELLAERFGTAPGVGKRAQFIATMHALITWFAEHPEMPTPDSIGFGADVHGDDLAALSEAHNARIYPGHDPRQLTLYPLGDPVAEDPRGEFYVPFHVRRSPLDRPL